MVKKNCIPFIHKDIPVVFNINDQYAKFLSVAMISILENTDEKLHFYILNNGITQKNKQKLLELQKIKPFDIDFIEISQEKLSHIPRGILSTADQVTNLRLLMASALPNLDKCILLDADLAFISDINELWEVDVTDYYMAAVIDPVDMIRDKKWTKRLPLSNEYPYFNTGVGVINLKKWRDDNVEELFLKNAVLYTQYLNFPDQDLLNLALYKHIKYLEPRYNAMSPDVYYNNELLAQSRKRPLLIHWAGLHKPWIKGENFYMRKLFWYYAKRSPFYNEMKDLE
ncbi:MAG: glycosyltransferase family 8 protein [Alphaproteobacteria bacterium]